MSTTRSVRPTDLVALVSLDGRVYLNEARTWDRLGRRPEGPRLLDSAIRPWFSVASTRHTWISIQGQSIGGLISARQRGNRAAWEIDCLIAASEDERAIGNVFDQVSAAAGRAGVLKVFLRLEAGSDLIAVARRAGFVPYQEEALLRSDWPVRSVPLAPELSVRPYQAADAFALYRLYNASVPESIRRIEAPTFQQWLATTERRGSGRAKRAFVVRRNDEAIALVRACPERDLARIDIVALPTAGETLSGLIDLACMHVGSRRPLFCLVPAHAAAVANALEESGFVLDSEYVAMAKRTAIPLAATRPSRVQAPAAQPIAAV
jgi:hypothetical protein